MLKRRLLFVLVGIVWACSVQAETLRLVTSHSETRLLSLMHEVAHQLGDDLEAVFIDQETLKNELLFSAEHNALPDILVIPSDIAGLEQLRLSPLGADWFDHNADPAISKMLPTVAKRLAIPLVMGNQLLQFYNKSLTAYPVADWDDLPDSRERALFSWSYNEMYWFVPFVLSKGPSFLSDNQSQLDTPFMVEALKRYKNLAARGVVKTDCPYACSVERFKQGEVAYHINGSWAIDELRFALGDKLGVAVLPAIGGVPAKSYYSSYVMVFPDLDNKPSEVQANIQQFALQMQSVSAQLAFGDHGYQMPVNLLARKAYLASDDPIIQAFTQQLEQSVLMPDAPQMIIVWDAMSRGFVRFSGGVLDAEGAARYMQKIYRKFSANH